MHLYKNFFRLLNRNKTGIVIYFGIFIVMISALFIVANMNSSAESEFNPTYHISYEDYDQSELSKGLIEYLSVNNNVEDLKGRSRSSVLDMVFFRITDYHMIIDEGFVQSVTRDGDMKISYDTSVELSGEVFGIDSLINNYISVYRDYKLMGMSDSEARQETYELLCADTTVKVLSDDNSQAKEDGKDLVIFQMNQFYCYLILGFLALGVGHTIIANNDRQVAKRIDASPIPGRMISISNTAGLMTAGLVVWLIYYLLNILFGWDTQLFREYWWLILVNSFLTMLAGCSIASFITSFNINGNTLSMVTNIVSLAMSFICGVFVPQWLLGDGVLKIARFLPFYWSVYANNMTHFSSGVSYDLKQLLTCFGMQLMFTAVIALAAAFVKSSRLSRV